MLWLYILVVPCSGGMGDARAVAISGFPCPHSWPPTLIRLIIEYHSFIFPPQIETNRKTHHLIATSANSNTNGIPNPCRASARTTHAHPGPSVAIHKQIQKCRQCREWV